MIHLKDRQDCSGCGACADACPQGCITLQGDAEGFLYPSVDAARCVECGLCEKVCPFLSPAPVRRPIRTWAAVSPDLPERLDSSSGGLFSLLMRRTLAAGGVVVGAAFDDGWGVRHVVIDSPDQMPALRGSKYVQSRTEGIYRETEGYLKQGREVLFSGTPCQVAGLKHYLRKEYDCLLTADVVCHGVPSPKVWEDYLRVLGDKPSIRAVRFRDKASGWSDYALRIDYADGRTVRAPHGADPYMQGFLLDFYTRPSCFRCKAKCGRSGSDLAMGDYWRVRESLPDLDAGDGLFGEGGGRRPGCGSPLEGDPLRAGAAGECRHRGQHPSLALAENLLETLPGRNGRSHQYPGDAPPPEFPLRADPEDHL